MGLILDLAVAALALVVIGSLAALAWTLGVSAVRAAARGREQVAALRRAAAEAESRLGREGPRVDAALVEGLRRTARDPARSGPSRPAGPPGDVTDA